jgi:hypothetical protein
MKSKLAGLDLRARISVPRGSQDISGGFEMKVKKSEGIDNNLYNSQNYLAVYSIRVLV